MTNFKIQLLAATILAGISSGAYAYNENSFVANDPTNTTKVAIKQTGDGHAVKGSVTGLRNSFAITQTGSNNKTEINGYGGSYPTQYITDSKITSNATGYGNQITIGISDVYKPYNPYAEPNYEIEKINVVANVNGSMNKVNTFAAGENTSSIINVQGSSNDISANAMGNGSKTTLTVNGNENNVRDQWVSTPQYAPYVGSDNTTLTTKITGSKNYVDHVDFRKNNNISESIQGNHNYIGNDVYGVDNTVKISQVGDDSGLYIRNDSNNSSVHGANIEKGRITLSSQGSANDVGVILSNNYRNSSNIDPSNFTGYHANDVISQSSLGDQNKLKSTMTMTDSVTNTLRANGSYNTLENTQDIAAKSAVTLAATGYGNELKSYQHEILGSKVNNSVAGNGNKITTSQYDTKNSTLAVNIVGDNNARGSTPTRIEQARTTDSVLSIKSTGNQNSLAATQLLTDKSKVQVAIKGNQNYLNVIQGEEQVFSQDTRLTNNVLIASLTGDGNGLFTNQLGNDNRINANIKGSGDSINATQMGDGNILMASITDPVPYLDSSNQGRNSITTLQTGNKNSMNTLINGTSNTLSGTQLGNGNVMRLTAGKTGGDVFSNTLTGTQTGNSNSMNVALYGSGNTGTFTQIGNGHKYNMSITSNNQTFNIKQGQ